MAKRSTITIQGHIFKSQEAAKDHVRATLKRYAPRGVVTGPADHALLLELVGRHPEALQKRGPGIARFHIQPNATNPRTKSGEFVLEIIIERTDGSKIDISWLTCVSGAAKTAKDNLIDAMRQAVKDDIGSFKQIEFARHPMCAECLSGLPDDFHVIHVDHLNHFSQLADDFLREVRNPPTAFDDCEVTHAAVFRPEDKDFKNTWVAYHRKRAKLRLLCRDCNLSRAKAQTKSIF